MFKQTLMIDFSQKFTNAAMAYCLNLKGTITEVESSTLRTSSRTHFEVRDYGLEAKVFGFGAYKFSKCPVLGSMIALFFD